MIRGWTNLSDIALAKDRIDLKADSHPATWVPGHIPGRLFG